MDIYFKLQIFIDKLKQNTLGARDTDWVWVTVYMERLDFFVLRSRKPPVFLGAWGTFPSRVICLDGRELIISLVAISGATW